MFDSLTICRQISDNLSRHEDVQKASFSAGYQRKHQATQWHDWTFANGTSGLTFLFTLLNEAFPNEGWDPIAHHYLKISVGYLRNQHMDNYGFLSGLAGIGTSLCSLKNPGDKERDFLERLDDHLIDAIKKNYLEQADRYCDENVFLPPHFYNLQDGLSGILGYLLLRQDHPRLRKLTFDCLDILVKVLSSEKKQGMPAWYVSPEVWIAEEVNRSHPNGFFLTSYQVGITGCLCAMSVALLAGISGVPNLLEAVHKVAYWLMDLRKQRTNYPGWSPVISQEGDTDQEDSEKTQDAFIIRSLYLAGKALQDRTLLTFSQEAFLALISRAALDRKWVGPSFSIGLSGFLGVSYLMSVDLKHHDMKRQLWEHERHLQRYYDPKNAFGFTPLLLEEVKHQESLHIPGFWCGSAGIVAILLLLQEKIDSKWSRSFLLA